MVPWIARLQSDARVAAAAVARAFALSSAATPADASSSRDVGATTSVADALTDRGVASTRVAAAVT